MGKNKDVFISSAEWGVPFGGLLTVASASMLFADKVSLLMLVVIFIALLAPVIIFYLQRKRFVRSDGFATYSELWVLGIFTTMCGAFLCGLVTYGLITLLRPDVVYEQMQMVADAYKQMPQPEAQEMARVVNKANRLLPADVLAHGEPGMRGRSVDSTAGKQDAVEKTIID